MNGSLRAGMIGFVLGLAMIGGALAGGKPGWTAYTNPRFGFILYYPPDMFRPGAEEPKDSGHTFASEKGDASIRVTGAYDELRKGAKHFSDKLKETEKGEVGDLKVEDFSYSYTADRGDRIHYQRVVFTCREQIINTLEYDYPKGERERYEAIRPKLIQRFQGGLGYDTPNNCL